MQHGLRNIGAEFEAAFKASHGWDASARALAEAEHATLQRTAEQQAEFRAQIGSAAKFDYAGLANIRAQMEAGSQASQARDASIRALAESGRAAIQGAVDRIPHIAAMAGPSAAARAQMDEAIRQISRNAARDQAQMRAAFKVPPAPNFGAILPPEPVMRYVEPPAIERNNSRISDLEDRVETLAGEIQALKAENQALAARCTAAEGKYEALERDHLELRTRRRAEFLDASQEHEPKPPVNESPFPDPK